jgi:hypothetical protein
LGMPTIIILKGNCICVQTDRKVISTTRLNGPRTDCILGHFLHKPGVRTS